MTTNERLELTTAFNSLLSALEQMDGQIIGIFTHSEKTKQTGYMKFDNSPLTLKEVLLIQGVLLKLVSGEPPETTQTIKANPINEN